MKENNNLKKTMKLIYYLHLIIFIDLHNMQKTNSFTCTQKIEYLESMMKNFFNKNPKKIECAPAAKNYISDMEELPSTQETFDALMLNLLSEKTFLKACQNYNQKMYEEFP